MITGKMIKNWVSLSASRVRLGFCWASRTRFGDDWG